AHQSALLHSGYSLQLTYWPIAVISDRTINQSESYSSEEILFRQPGNRSIELQHGKKCLLWNLHISYLAHSFLSFFLFLEQLSFSGDVTTVAFCRNIFSQCPHRFPCNYFGADTSLNGDFELLSGNQFTHFQADSFSEIKRVIPVNERRKCIHLIAIEHDVELYKVRYLIPDWEIVKRCISAGNRFELV